jgi:hypothetical protein
MSLLTDAITGLTGPVADYFKRRAELKVEQAKFESEARIKDHELLLAQKTRQIELVSQGLTADANWEMEFARQAASSWKDEYTLIVVSMPAVMAFIPGLDIYVLKGFAALAKTPVWYQIMLVSLFFATVGIRYWRRTQSDTP